MPIAADPELQAQYQAWEASRKGFLHGLQKHDPEAVKRGWQKDYFQGKTPDGQEFDAHQTRLAIREFAPSEAPGPAARIPADGGRRGRAVTDRLSPTRRASGSPRTPSRTAPSGCPGW